MVKMYNCIQGTNSCVCSQSTAKGLTRSSGTTIGEELVRLSGATSGVLACESFFCIDIQLCHQLQILIDFSVWIDDAVRPQRK